MFSGFGLKPPASGFHFYFYRNQKKKINICIERNENKNTTTQDLWDTIKAVLRGKFIAIHGIPQETKKSNK